MPLVALPKVTLFLVDVAAWGTVHALTGFAAHHLSVDRLRRSGRLLRLRAWERSGAVYRHIGVHRWKDRVPEAGDVFPGGMSKRSIPATVDGGLPRLAAETRRAEIGHWWCALAGPLFALWNPWPIAVVMTLYGIGVNLPFIVIQRYNRGRIERVLTRALARSRTDLGTMGNNIP